jgi:hypothetical protein
MFSTRYSDDSKLVAIKVGVVAEQLIGGQVQCSIFGHGERIVHGRVSFIDVIDFDLDIACPRFRAVGACDLEVDLGHFFEVQRYAILQLEVTVFDFEAKKFAREVDASVSSLFLSFGISVGIN